MIARISLLFVFCLPLLLAFDKKQKRSDLVGKLYILRSNGGLCGSSIYFLNDSFFFSESGCEASSYYNFGRWRQKKDTLFFNYDSTLFVSPIVRFQKVSANQDSIGVCVEDVKTGILPTFVLAIRTRRRNLIPLNFDSSHQQFRSSRLCAGDTVHLQTIENGYYKSFVLPVDSPGNYELTLNLPPNLGSWTLSRRERYSRTSIFIHRGDNLTSDGPEWGGNPVHYELAR
jgi:hypothetical protein